MATFSGKFTFQFYEFVSHSRLFIHGLLIVFSRCLVTAQAYRKCRENENKLNFDSVDKNFLSEIVR